MDSTAGAWLGGFFLLGTLLGLPGPLFVAWRYHINLDPQLVGLHFLAVNAGYLLAAAAGPKLLFRIQTRILLRCSCGIALAGIAALAIVAPPAPLAARLATWAIIGAAAGALATALLFGLRTPFTKSASLALNRAGALVGSGCLFATFIVGATYFAVPGPLGTALLGLAPLAFFLLYLRTGTPLGAAPFPGQEHEALRKTMRDLRSVATVLLSLLLFFQFGNEWAIAGWLPLFVIHRVGANPAVALGTLALYLLALTLGRLAAQRILNVLEHRTVLIVSVAAAVCGCIVLGLASTLTVISSAVVLLGFAFAPILPVVAEQLDDRFSFHPGFYNGTISIAITGAMSVPGLLGLIAGYCGMRCVVLLPAVGSAIVLIIALLMMFEAHLMGAREIAEP